MPRPAPRLKSVRVFFGRQCGKFGNEPDEAIHIAMQLPKNQHHTAVAGPPEVIGTLKVAGTDPKTPRMEMA
jgi:hypothetical protein